MKKIYLICNAHLDPVWLWQWKEGAAEAMSTFRVAADFCEKYDEFVFNHNESLLYEWVEEYEPELFERIKKLVKNGKWKIMGGWYLQPDCTMLSGESFLSQIELGRKYFKEKFDVVPETAVNFDPFGHTKGLVQILEKTGFKSYLVARPGDLDRNFVWDGFADTSVLVNCVYGGYGTIKGKATEKLSNCIKDCNGDEIVLMTWGIGNHGGGPSRVDLESLNKVISERDDIEIIHSTPDDYFREIDREKLPHNTRSLEHVMMGCYSSMNEIKKTHRKLENSVAVMNKMATIANLTRGVKYPEADIVDIRKALAFSQFHDVLPGSCIKPAEQDGLRGMSYALEKCDKIIARSFFALAKGQKAASEGEIPVMIYNPHPYKIRDTFEVEFLLQSQNWNEDEVTLAEVFDENGNRVACQHEKPESTINLDWVKKISFAGEIAPCSMSRFNCRLTTVKKQEIEREYDEKITVNGADSSLVIDRNTGLIEKYVVNGKEMIKNSGVLEVYKDNEDPWGMTVDGYYDKVGEFKLLNERETGKYLGYDKCVRNVVISEDGEVRTKIDAFFGYESSYATVEYLFDKLSDDLNIKITLNSSCANKCIKYRIDTNVENGSYYGQTAFGSEELSSSGIEVTYQKWCGIKNADRSLYVINDSIYAGSFKQDKIYLTLLRTPVYSAHPIDERQIAPQDRYLKHIDMGERTFEFKITAKDDQEKKALVFNEKPIVISYFPKEEKCDNSPYIEIDNENIQMSNIKLDNGNIVMHLFNSSPNVEDVRIRSLFADDIVMSFRGYELKFITVCKGTVSELEKVYCD